MDGQQFQFLYNVLCSKLKEYIITWTTLRWTPHFLKNSLPSKSTDFFFYPVLLPNGKYFWDEEYSFPRLTILFAIMLIRSWEDSPKLLDISPSMMLFQTVSISMLSGCPAQFSIASWHSQRLYGSANSAYSCEMSNRSAFNYENKREY